jgi:hypothetical protein
MSRDRLVLLALAAVTVVVVIAMTLKHGHETDVSADGGKPTAPVTENHASAPPQAPTQPAPDVGSTAQDRAFFDKKNRVTIRVGQYDNDPTGVATAQAAYRYLLTEGALAVRPIVGLDAQHVVLCVDAKPKKDDLENLRWLQELRGPPSGKKFPFADAWIDNIDHVVHR